ncbi:DNA-processing protein DprA [bacterium]|nr:DNA-processing protein DprA [bacterium]
MSERAYAVAFLNIEGVGSTRLRRMRDRFGSLEAAWRAGPRELAQVQGIGPEIAQAIAAQRPELMPEAELAAVSRAGLDLVCHWDSAYPAALREIHDPPGVLFVKGELPDLSRAVAIVGTRRCTRYGARMAETLARDLAASGVVVVSGLAFGVDAAAHKGALETGKTVAVLGSALDRLYPAGHQELATRIAERGALLSEYPLGTEPAAGQFPARNRIVAGLCQAVVLVEAKERSGALITVEMALDQNREVMAVPGPADAPCSLGPHRLIQQGARLVMSASDVLEELAWKAPKPPAREAPRLALADDEARVLAAIEGEPTSLDRIAAKSGLPPAQINSVLLVLELKALVQQLPGRLYVRA